MTSSIDASRAGGSGRPRDKIRVAIIGGGPGGLFTAWHLEAKAGDACEIEIYESSERIGGKICTGQMAGVIAGERGAVVTDAVDEEPAAGHKTW